MFLLQTLIDLLSDSLFKNPMALLALVYVQHYWKNRGGKEILLCYI